MSERIGRPEAFDIFGKWLDEGTLLRCDFAFGWFSAVFRARVKVVAEDRLRLLSDDTSAELTLVLPPDVDFRFADSRADPAFKELASVLCLAVPDSAGFLRGSVCLSEAIEPS